VLALALALAFAACGKAERSGGEVERAPPPRVAPSPPPSPPPPAFAVNRGAAILAREHLAAGPPDGDDWPGRWTGTQLLVGGPITGSLPVDMEITRRTDGQLQLVQAGFGVTVVQVLVESPDNPTVAAGVNRETRTVNTVTFTQRQDITAIRTGSQLVIGMVVETEDAGSYQGTPIPPSPPQESLTRLERKTRYLPVAAPDAAGP